MKNSNNRYYGLFVKLLTTPAMYLMAKDAGLDFVFYDNEHSVFSKSKLHDLMLFGNNIGLPSFVRVAELNKRGKRTANLGYCDQLCGRMAYIGMVIDFVKHSIFRI